LPKSRQLDGDEGEDMAEHATEEPEQTEAAPLPESPQATPSGPAGSWHLATVDDAFRVLVADAAFVEAFGASEIELRHRGVLEFLHPAERPRRALAALARAGRGEACERVTIRHPDGRFRTADLTALALPAVPGSPARIALALAVQDRGPRTAPRAHQELLTALDAQVLEGLAAGVATRSLAKRLKLSRQGVDYHIGLMTRKLGAANRTALIAKAHSLGLFAAGEWPPRVAAEFVAAEGRLGHG
jgi:DNA-binding CsgD family transcriptional regulator